MKKRLLSCLFLLVVAAGCTSEEQDNLVTYTNDKIQPIASLEEEAVSKYESVTGDNVQDNETLQTALTDTVIPKYEEFVDKLEDIEVDDEAISDVHDMYIDAANKQLDAFQTSAEALKAQDMDQIEDANQTLDEAYQGLQAYRSSLEALADERDVEFEDEE